MKYYIILTAIFSISTSSSAQANNDTFSIYFNNGSAQLNARANYLIDSLLYYDVIIPQQTFIIIGYADIIGSEKSNTTLSKKRADVVADYLMSMGIKKIESVVAKGEINRPEQPMGYPEDRRVDIVIASDSATKNTIKIDIKELKQNDVFNLENMFFVGGLPIILKKSVPTLKSLLLIMKENPTLKIRIEGHVHCELKGTYSSYNVQTGQRVVQRRTHEQSEYEEFIYKQLSTSRAKMVHDYLVDNNIDKKRLQYKGMACKEMALYPNNNRRVAIRILAK